MEEGKMRKKRKREVKAKRLRGGFFISFTGEEGSY